MDRKDGHKWDIGDELVVCGDKKKWDHGLAPGRIVKVTRFFEWKETLGYEVESADDERPGWGFNVAQVDLKLNVKPVTEDEMAEVLKSLGVQ